MINRDKLIRIAAKKAKQKIKVVEPVVLAYEDAILQSLLSGEEVWLRGFLTFRIKDHVPKVYYNPQTGEKKKLKGKKVIKVIPSQVIQDYLTESLDEE